MVCRAQVKTIVRRFICDDCSAERGVCVECSGDMPKYSRKDGGIRLTCSQACHNRHILKIPGVRKKLNESRRATSASMWQSEEYRRKHRASMEHVWNSPEWRKKHSDSMRRRWEDPEFRKTMVSMLKELWATDEFADIARKNSDKAWADQRARGLMLAALKRNWESPEIRMRISARTKKMWSQPGARKRFSDQVRERWKNSEYRSIVVSKIKSNRRTPIARMAASENAKRMWINGNFDNRTRGRSWGITDIERMTVDSLVSFGISEFYYNFPVGRFRLDIAFPDLLVDIECDGLFWHKMPGVPEKDARRDEYMKSLGWAVVRLTEKEIREDVNSAVIEKVITALLARCE